jgi:hypothetical protein
MFLDPRDTLYPKKLALTSLTSGGRSVCIVRLRTTSHGVFFSLLRFWTLSIVLSLSKNRPVYF